MYGYFCIGFTDFMLAGKKVTYYTNLFSPHDLKKRQYYNFVLFQKWMKNNSIKNNSLETIDKTVLSEQAKFRLSEIIGIEN